MEVLREEALPRSLVSGAAGFNPCFNGSVERGVMARLKMTYTDGFNPCFNGSVERGNAKIFRRRADLQVSILVLMEVLREGALRPLQIVSHFGFNPCFNGSVERGASIFSRRLRRSRFQSLF